MKKLFKPFAVVCAAVLLMTSCKKDVKDAVSNEVSQETLSQLQHLGFSTDGVQKVDGGYLVEGDIFMNDDQLKESPTSPNMVIANEEHYHTFYMVSPTKHPTITVALNSSNTATQAAFSAALDEAIRRYNALGLSINFQRATGTSGNITVVAFYQVSNTLGSSGFPNSAGDPYNQVQMNTYWYNGSTSTSNVNYIASIMAHEIGHCIGFRHTDYMNRAYSCGGRKQNEGQTNSGVGAVYIPGTPSGPDANSWMLACTGDQVNRPFTSNDQIALNYVY